MKRFVSAILALTAGAAMFTPSVSNALPPDVFVTDEGAFVRLLGDPSTGSVKFQYGWNAELADENPEGYWLGIYDVTNSHYVWAFDTNSDPEDIPTWSLHPSLDLTQAMKRNAKPTEYLPNGHYKVNFFVRDAYGEPTTNISEIEFHFYVTNSST